MSARNATTQVKVLYVDTVSRFWTRLDRNYRLKYERLSRAHGNRRFTIADAAQISHVPRDVSSYGVLLVGVFAAIGSPSDGPKVGVPQSWLRDIRRRCVMVEDMRDHNGRKLSSILGNDYNYLLATYDCAELNDLLAGCPSIRKSWVIPHHVDTDIYRDMRIDRCYDVLLYGSTDARTYPFRARLRRVLQEAPLRTKIVEYPDTDEFDPSCCGEGLAGLINQSWISIATPSRHDYLVAKYFEAAACGAVVAGKMATQGLPIWKDRYIALDETMSDAEIVSCLREALRNRERLREMAGSMADVIRQEYNLDRYVEKLTGVVDEIAADHSIL